MHGPGSVSSKYSATMRSAGRSTWGNLRSLPNLGLCLPWVYEVCVGYRGV